MKPIWTANEAEKIQMTPKTTEIISKLCKYIDGVITLKEFGDWFVPAVWNANPKDLVLNKLVYSIKLHFAAYGNGKYTKEELRERLIDLIL